MLAASPSHARLQGTLVSCALPSIPVYESSHQLLIRLRIHVSMVYLIVRICSASLICTRPIHPPSVALILRQSVCSSIWRCKTMLVAAWRCTRATASVITVPKEILYPRKPALSVTQTTLMCPSWSHWKAYSRCDARCAFLSPKYSRNCLSLVPNPWCISPGGCLGRWEEAPAACTR